MNKKNRESTNVRYNEVNSLYEQLIKELGELKHFITRSYLYTQIQKKTGLSIRQIQRILSGRK